MACVTFAVICGLWPARAAHAGSEVKMKAHEAQSGALLFKPKDGGDTCAVLRQSTDVTIRVSGIVARATVRQTFRNPHHDWFEGIYVFPLPENAAVDHMKIRIGPREEITVELEYQQTLRYDNGRFSLRFPTVVTPRYIPGNAIVARVALRRRWVTRRGDLHRDRHGAAAARGSRACCSPSVSWRDSGKSDKAFTSTPKRASRNT